MVKTIIDTSKHQEGAAEMRHLFSPHQIDVLDLVREGLKNWEIVRCLSMTESMIKNDLRRIFDRNPRGSCGLVEKPPGMRREQGERART
jgi:DNA-binding CsgD family transcriptional regulator